MGRVGKRGGICRGHAPPPWKGMGILLPRSDVRFISCHKKNWQPRPCCAPTARAGRGNTAILLCTLEARRHRDGSAALKSAVLLAPLSTLPTRYAYATVCRCVAQESSLVDTPQSTRTHIRCAPATSPAAAGDGELNQGVRALVCAYTSVSIDLHPPHVMASGKRQKPPPEAYVLNLLPPGTVLLALSVLSTRDVGLHRQHRLHRF